MIRNQLDCSVLEYGLMKFPSLFRLPQHRRFEYRPQFYDPELEERKQRRGSSNLLLEKEDKTSSLGEDQGIRSRNRISFRRRIRPQSSLSSPRVLWFRAFFIILFFGSAMAYLGYGIWGLYIILGSALVGFLMIYLGIKYRKTRTEQTHGS
ncbi:MAG: hypothetical protein OXB93_06370 [Cytophagales bacterium]|nr:hypothetical protein [Cytophagales bacterium]